MFFPWAYVSMHGLWLTGQVGEEFELVAKEGCGDGWWRGMLGGRMGVFPKAYVMEKSE